MAFARDRVSGELRALVAITIRFEAIEGGGMYLNNARVESVDAVVTVEDAVEGRFLVLRKGKKSYMLVQLEG